MSSNANVETIESYRPEIRKVFDEFTKVIKWCGGQERWYAFSAGLLALSMIQAIGLFLDGAVRKERGANREQFDMALDKYFNPISNDYALPNVRQKLWSRARCGLSHDLTIHRGVGISWQPTFAGRHLQEEEGVLMISMIELTKHLEEATKRYLDDLASNESYSTKYNAVIHQIEKT